MHHHSLEPWKHAHDYTVIHDQGERRTLVVLVLTAVTMVAEIVAGSLFGSMALLADGWHMGTHVAAFMIALFAYRYARKHSHTGLYTFGTGKVTVLGGFASAIALLVVALVMVTESVQRMVQPQAISFDEAIFVAVLGLVVNLVCAVILQGRHDHGHSHGHDHNLKAAYVHVLADALTSVLALVALFSGKYYGWTFLDPLMGIVGALVITRWSFSLMKDTGPILLDQSMDDERVDQIIRALESDGDPKISDLHLWKVGPHDYAAVISLVADNPKPPAHYKALLKDIHGLGHVTVEINPCKDA